MADMYRKRRVIIVIFSLLIFTFAIIANTPNQSNQTLPIKNDVQKSLTESAILALESLPIKGRAPKTNYSREQFGGGWKTTNGCDTRNIILNRDLSNVVINEVCEVTSGTLNDPYSGKTIQFVRGSDTSGDIQIDHVVSLSDAWQKGAQQLTLDQRTALANDPLELLAVDGPTNQQKSDGDAATWLPPNKAFRCQYIARQIAVKQKYQLWVTLAEHDTMNSILNNCPGQLLPSP